MEVREQAEPQTLDLPRLLAALRARKLTIVVPTALAFLAALVFVSTTTPRYTSVAKALLERPDAYFSRPDKAAPETGTPIDEDEVQSQVEAAKSPDIARKAIAQLHVGERAEFNARGLLSSLFGAFGRSDDASQREDRLLEAFSSRVNILAPAKSHVLQFEFSSADPQFAARGANTLAQLFLDSQRDAKSLEAKTAANWLSGKIDQLRTKVAEADTKVEELRASSGLLTGANNMSAPSQQLAEAITQIAAARANQSAANAKAQIVRDMLRNGRLDNVPEVTKDDSLRRIEEQRVTLKGQIAELSRTLLPGHPRMKELNGQLSAIEQELRVGALRQARGFEDDARIAAEQVKSLQSAVATQAKVVSDSDADQIQIKQMELEAKSARDQLESYLAKYREAIARDAENAAPADARIIATAVVPRSPSYPKKVPTLTLAPLAALLLSIGYVIGRTLLSDPSLSLAPAVASPEEAEAAAPANRTEPATALPFGIDPRQAAAAPREGEAPRRPDSWPRLVEAYVDKLAEVSGGDAAPILVTAEGGAGALPPALTAARRLARLEPTVLIDLGPSPSWLSDLFDRDLEKGSATQGLSDLVEGTASFEHVLHRDISSRLDVIPSGHGVADTAALPGVLQALRETYRHIVLHAPDWRAPAPNAALEEIAAVLLCAPAVEVGPIEDRLRAAWAEHSLPIKVFATQPKPLREKAA